VGRGKEGEAAGVLYQRPEGRDVARVPWARGVDAEVAGAAMAGASCREWQVRQGHRCEVGTGSKEPSSARKGIGFEIILQSSRILLPPTAIFSPSNEMMLANRTHIYLSDHVSYILILDRTPMSEKEICGYSRNRN